MGQYHSVINLDKRAGYSPRSLGSFIKLMEQCHTPTATSALLLLLSDPLGWGGERIAVVGDYAEDRDLPTTDPHPASELWERVAESRGMKNVGWLARKVVEDAGIATFKRETWKLRDGSNGTITDIRHYESVLLGPTDSASAPRVVVVNHDRAQTITPTLLGDPGTLLETAFGGVAGGTGTALYVLLAASNKDGARGGGDIHSDSPLVGSWAGDRISVLPESEVPIVTRDITPAVREVLADAREGGYRVDEDGSVKRLDWGELFTDA